MTKLENAIKEVDVVFVHKDEWWRDAFSYFAAAFDKQVDIYPDPRVFLNNASRYSKHTQIIVGRTFHNSTHHGIQIAEQLHALGFTRIYLLVMFDPSGKPVPDYLTVINLEFDDIEDIFSEDNLP